MDRKVFNTCHSYSEENRKVLFIMLILTAVIDHDKDVKSVNRCYDLHINSSSCLRRSESLKKTLILKQTNN